MDMVPVNNSLLRVCTGGGSRKLKAAAGSRQQLQIGRAVDGAVNEQQ